MYWWLGGGLALVNLLMGIGLIWIREVLTEGRIRDGKLDKLNDKVAIQNGRIGRVEEWQTGHTRHTDDQNRRLDSIEERERRRLESTGTRRPREN